MIRDFDSTDRTPVDYLLFALACIGFVLALAGVILSVPALAVLGAIVFIFSAASFRGRSTAEA